MSNKNAKKVQIWKFVCSEFRDFSVPARKQIY